MRTRWITMGLLVLACVAPTAWAQPAPAHEEHAPPPPSREVEAGDADLGWLLADLGPEGRGERMAPEDGVGPGERMSPPQREWRERGGFGSGGRHFGGRMGPMGGFGGALREKLNLTEAQKTKMSELRDRQARRGIEGRAQLEVAALDLHKLMRVDKPDLRAIDTQIDRIASLRADLQKSRVAAMLEGRALLTPAQQKILEDAREGHDMPPPPPGARRKL